MRTLDQIDRGILRLLQKNAKLTNKEMAQELNLSVTPIYERIKRLERDGFIKAYRAELDRRQLGFKLQAFCNVSLQEHQTEYLRRFERDVRKLPEVLACYHIAGNFDYLLHVVVHDMEAYQTFVADRLAGLDHIRQVQSSFVMTEVKEGAKLPISLLK